jgi:arylsulfatase A-like enzyme
MAKLAGILMATLLLALTTIPVGGAQTIAEGRPNVLLIITDDQRASTLKNMPITKAWMKKGGTHFANAFATTPLCCPSRASIFTGRYAHNHRVRNNSSTSELDHKTTVQRHLHRAGYRTAIYGKFLNAWPIAKNPPHFDEWATFGPSRTHYYDGEWNVNGAVRPVSHYSTDYIKRRAVDFLNAAEQKDTQPWFLVLSTAAPHAPAIAEPAYAHRHVPPWSTNPATNEANRTDKPPFVQALSAPLWKSRAARRAQLRTLLSVDELVGRVFRKLEAADDKRNTLVIYVSDNGYLWGEHGLSGPGVSKRPPYSASVAIPLMMRWPGQFSAGKVRKGLAANIDIAPTIMQATQVDPGPDFRPDGRSLLQRNTRDRLLLEYWVDIGGTPTWASLRTKSYQYIEYYDNDGLTPVFKEYYDLKKDPWQLKNLLGDANPVNDPAVGEAARQLDSDRHCSESSCP